MNVARSLTSLVLAVSLSACAIGEIGPGEHQAR